jgi:hypothetical protein
MTLCLKFRTDDEDINKRVFEFDASMTVEQMLKSFLSQTNSKMILDPYEISFLFGGKILNKQENIGKLLSSVFTARNNKPITVSTSKNIIGGY